MKRVISWVTLQPLSEKAADAIREIVNVSAEIRARMAISENGGFGCLSFWHKVMIFDANLGADYANLS